MLGESDLYVAARRILLDGLKALDQHLDSVVLVGAQAIYLHTGDADLAVVVYTKDADVVLDPARLRDNPLIEAAMRGAGFDTTGEPGRWVKDEIPIDLMVPEALAGAGRRGADLGPHGRKAARRARGLEAALIDKSVKKITSLEDSDSRVFRVAVAGPCALLVAKVHKIAERAGEPGRLQDKDALDVLRLLRAVRSETLVEGLNSLTRDNLAGETTKQGILMLRDLFGTRGGNGALLAARALEGLQDEETVTRSCEALVGELLETGLEIEIP